MNSIKYFVLILIISCIYTDTTLFIKNQCSIEQYTNSDTKLPNTRYFEAKSGNDCKDRKILEYDDNSYDYTGKLLDDKVKTFYTHCCHITYDRIKDDKRGENSKGESIGIEGYCIRLTDTQYKNIKEYALGYALDIERDNVKIDCNTNYLQFGLSSLILLILF